MSSKPLTVLITGATGGIGLELARRYAAPGARLILVGRRPLATLSDPLFSPASYCRADLRRPDKATEAIICWLHDQGITQLDRLIHNAGIGHYGPPAATPPERTDELLAVNLQTPIRLTHALLPLVQAAQGAVVFVGSVATALPTPEYAVYTATKAALESFARSLRVELRRQVRVQVVRPGATRTGIHASSGVPPGRLKSERFPPATIVAAEMIAAIEAGRRSTTIGAGNRLVSWVGRNLGGVVDRLIQ
jgi:short-subunit dehydrogenase